MVEPQGKVDHLGGFRNNLRAAAEASQEMADIAVVLLDGEGQILADEMLGTGDRPPEALPVVGEEAFAFDPDLVEKSPEGPVITATQHPGEGAAGNGVVGPPNPELARLFLRKCHISSQVTTTVPADADGSGTRRAASRTQSSTVTLLTPRMRAMPRKPMLPMAYSSSASAFISGRLARLWRHREVAAASPAAIALQTPGETVFHMVRCLATLADDLVHGPSFHADCRTYPIY